MRSALLILRGPWKDSAMSDTHGSRSDTVRRTNACLPRPDEPQSRRHRPSGSTRCAIAPCRLRRASTSIRPLCASTRSFVAQATRPVPQTPSIAVAAVANFPLGTSPADEVIDEVEQALAGRRGRDRCRAAVPCLPRRRHRRGRPTRPPRQHGLPLSTRCRRSLKVILETGVLHDVVDDQGRRHGSLLPTAPTS